MVGKKTTRLKPSKKGRQDSEGWARRASEINERLAAEGYHFGDSAEIIQADRGSRV